MPKELLELVTAFNAMLVRLHESFRRLAEFSSDIAHELRTPIHNLLIQTQVTLGGKDNIDAYRAMLQSNEEEYQRLSAMISDMLFLAKADNKQASLKKGTAGSAYGSGESVRLLRGAGQRGGIALRQSG